MSLPPAYEAPSARKRIARGLVAAGCNEVVAEEAARIALAEAPFAAPTEAGWEIACQRARRLATLPMHELRKLPSLEHPFPARGY